MPIAFALQGQVSQPSVGVDDAPRRYRALYKGNQAFGRRVRNLAHTNPADPWSILLCSNHKVFSSSSAVPAGPPPVHRHSIHPLRPGRSAGLAPVSPWRGAIYAATSRPSRSSSDPALVAAPTRWRRSSEWSPTTWLETTTAEKCGCPEKSFPRSPRFDVDSHDSATVPL